MPPEARAAMLREARHSMRQGALAAGISYLTWFAYLPLMLWMGMRSWTAWLVESAAWLVAAALAFRSWRDPPRDGKPATALWVAGVVALSSTYTLFGPYVVVPALATMGSLLLHVAPARAHRVPVVVANCLAIAVPAGLQMTGVIPPSYVFENGTIRIMPMMLDFPPVATNVFLVVACMALIITASTIMARFRNAIGRIEEKIHVQAWQLQQLVPEEARRASAPIAPESVAALPAEPPSER
jgi:hypothetical protein